MMCDGTNWRYIREDISNPVAPCIAQSQALNYSSSQFYACRNGTWYALRPGTVGTSCSTPGQMQYVSGSTAYSFCNGTNWNTLDAATYTMPTSGLVANWSMDATSGTSVVDTINANNGSFVGSPAWRTTGGTGGGALYFDGASYISISDSATLDTLNDFSAGGWVYFSSAPADAGTQRNSRIMQKGAAVPTTTSYALHALTSAGGGQNKAIFCVYKTDTQTCATGTTDMSAFAWHHVMGTRSGSTLKIYVDGVLETTATGPSGSLDDEANMYFARSPGNTDGYMIGLLDDLRVYNRALSQTEIENIVQNPPSIGLISHWAFDESSGTVASDGMGTNNGTTTAGQTWYPATGKFAGALAFDGIAQYASTPHSATLDTLGDFTAAGWFYLSAQPPASGKLRSPRIMQKGHSVPASSAYYLEIKSTSGVGTQPELCVYQSGIKTCATSPADASLNAWHHVAGTRSGTTLKVYVDGTLAATTIGPSGFLDDGSEMNFGNSPNNSDGLMYGMLDDLRVYNRALTLPEIQYLYANPP